MYLQTAMGQCEVGVPIMRDKQRLLILTPGPRPLRGPPSLPSPILLPNNDSYRQNSALHCFAFDRMGVLIDIFRRQSLEKNDTILQNINRCPFDPYIHIYIYKKMNVPAGNRIVIRSLV